MDRVEALCKRALIGRLEYTRMGKNDWQLWASENWKPLFSYTPSISLLARGWIVIVFLEEAHALIVLNSFWRIREGSLVLDRWHIHFDPHRERVKKRHLWVILPGLPFPLWNRDVMEGIGDTIGRFVAVEDDFLHTFDKRMAKILVEMDLSIGLPAEIDIICQERII